MNRYTCKTLHTSRFVSRKIVGVLITLLGLLLTSCSTMHARLTYDFDIDPQDGRIFYEPGTEDAAAEISTNLNDDIELIETAQFGKFRDSSNIKIYIFNDKKRYARFRYNSGASTFGGATDKEAFISFARIRERLSESRCQIEVCPETVDGILLHELSHVHVAQSVGRWRYISDIPGWFHEGLATLVSGGAGGGLVSEADAKKSILSGSHLVPSDTGSVFKKPETVGDLMPGTFRFYRQSQMFVEFLRNLNSAGFRNALEGIYAGRKFRTVWEPNYGANIADLWAAFTLEL